MVRFLTNSSEVKQIIKGLNLTKSLFVSSIIIGEPHTGKKTLASSVFPHAPIVDAKDTVALLDTLNNHDEVVIHNFNEVRNFDKLDFSHKRIIAVADTISRTRQIDHLFGFIYTMPPLRNRAEDVRLLSDMFKAQACETLMLPLSSECDVCKFDLSQNTKSLKASIYKQLLYHYADKESIEQMLFSYFYRTLEAPDGYKKHLTLFERPLIKAGLKRYRSQLRLSEILGINRNTLRKKIHEHQID